MGESQVGPETSGLNTTTIKTCQHQPSPAFEAGDPLDEGTSFCSPVFDGFLCWPQTKAGDKVYLQCPDGVRGLDPEKFVYRQCQQDGTWFSCGSQENSNLSLAERVVNDNVGWTNYSHCWTATTRKLMADLNFEPTCPDSQAEKDSTVEIKMMVARMSRILEMVGYSLSFVVLIFALATFCYFRKLRKPRVTRIHMNLFASMILQSFIRLIIYADQMVVRQSSLTDQNNTSTSSQEGDNSNSGSLQSEQSNDRVWGIDNTPFLCQTFYTLIEYGKTTMFLWMFIEGIILHHMTTVAYSRGPENQLFFYLCGWLIPIPLTAVWLITMIFDADADSRHCGQGYSFLSSYWILEGPRIAVIMLNILILLNVMRVLFTHLSGNETSDTKQIRKSLKSLFFLLPLLGITNVLHFVWPNPLRGTWLSFAVWSFASHFLYSFQGFFVASVYFFFDDKVKDTLYKFWVLKVKLRDRSGGGGSHNNICGAQSVVRGRTFDQILDFHSAAPVPNATALRSSRRQYSRSTDQLSLYATTSVSVPGRRISSNHIGLNEISGQRFTTSQRHILTPAERNVLAPSHRNLLAPQSPKRGKGRLRKIELSEDARQSKTSFPLRIVSKFSRYGRAKPNNQTGEDFNKPYCEELDIFSEKIESVESCRQREGSSSESSNSGTLKQKNRIKQKVDGIEPVKEDKSFYTNNRLAAKITVDVTVEFERDQFYKSKVGETRTSNGL